MFYLNPGNNYITLTLREKSTIHNPYYTFSLVRKGSFENVIFYQDDSSSSPLYWNGFTISVGTVSGLTSGMISVNQGEWNYTVYQHNEPYILSTSSVILEEGICVVLGTTSTINAYQGGIDDTIKYYNNI